LTIEVFLFGKLQNTQEFVQPVLVEGPFGREIKAFVLKNCTEVKIAEL